MSRNCKKVRTDPEFGCFNVSCSKVMALLQHPPKMREMVVNHVDKGVNIVNKRSRITRRQISIKFMSPLRLIPRGNHTGCSATQTPPGGSWEVTVTVTSRFSHEPSIPVLGMLLDMFIRKAEEKYLGISEDLTIKARDDHQKK
jgi:hypothetical protein